MNSNATDIAVTQLADAYGASMTAIVGVLASLSAQIDRLHATLSKRFAQHPDAEILRSLPGLGIVLGSGRQP